MGYYIDKYTSRDACLMALDPETALAYIFLRAYADSQEETMEFETFTDLRKRVFPTYTHWLESEIHGFLNQVESLGLIKWNRTENNHIEVAIVRG